MEVQRQIGDVDLLIDCAGPHDIYFEEGFLEGHGLSGGASQLDICKVLSKDRFRPIYLMWEIVDKCDFACPFCYIVGHSSNRLVRFEETKEAIDDLIDQGLLYCLLTGGEATIHPDFCEMYKYLKERGVVVEVYTNGAQLKPQIIELFSRYQPYKLEISIYGVSDEVFQTNTRSKYKASDVLSNIEALKYQGVNVVCKTAINALTATEIDQIREWCSDRGITHYHSSEITTTYDNDPLVKYVAPDEIRIRFEAENEKSFIDNYGPQKTGVKKSCFSCAVGSYGVHINSNFELQPCSSFNGKKPGHEIRELGMAESLRRMYAYVTATQGKPIMGCVGCEASSHCKMCPALGEEVYIEGGLIGYKTSNQYCNKIRKNYRKEIR